MKSDFDRLMQERGLAAVLIAGGEGYSEVRDYMTNGAHITGGYVIKKPGADPILIVSGMETDEARKSGYPVKSWSELGFFDLLKDNDPDRAGVLFWGNCLRHAAGVAVAAVINDGNLRHADLPSVVE